MNTFNNQFFSKLKDIIIDKENYYNSKILDTTINDIVNNYIIFLKNIINFKLNIKKDNIFYFGILLLILSCLINYIVSVSDSLLV
tara:strand:+ start:403 stop:657 length:255 start_codon:yes stop_codon:yes gene_type:complete